MIGNFGVDKTVEMLQTYHGYIRSCTTFSITKFATDTQGLLLHFYAHSIEDITHSPSIYFPSLTSLC